MKLAIIGVAAIGSAIARILIRAWEFQTDSTAPHTAGPATARLHHSE